MKIVALVPVKSLAEAKSRLAEALSPAQRRALALDMLRHVLASIVSSGAVDRIAVISPEPDTLPLPPGTIPLTQSRSGLNNVLEQGRVWAASTGAEALLVAHADLPLLNPEDIRAMAALADAPNTVVLAPDRHQVGTNLMLVRPLARAHFSFGTRSYQIHRSKYTESGMAVETYISRGTSLDVDTPVDLAYLAEQRDNPAFTGSILSGLDTTHTSVTEVAS
ncbi:MAG: 2-phospho-L-lactate guanylyltransferase [Chloroflexia bacterium]